MKNNQDKPDRKGDMSPLVIMAALVAMLLLSLRYLIG
jgi:hypothetical protein